MNIMGNEDAKWINHEYLYTYQIASRVEHVAINFSSYFRELEALTLDLGISDFISHWQKESALHKFIRYIADGILESENSGKNRIPYGDPTRPKWTLPLEAAFVIYELQEEVGFEIPKIPPIEKKNGNLTVVEDAPELLDACYEYFQDMRWTQIYEDLMQRISDEVFYVMFTNRVALQGLHEYLAFYVKQCEPEFFEEDHPDLIRCFSGSGKLKRTKIPKWARRAVFFRDRGICTKCKKDISGLLDRFNVENYDHMVPLANGGLNDVTNLQLLCESCNKSKSATSLLVSNSYQRWY